MFACVCLSACPSTSVSVCVSCSAQTTITHLKKFVSLKLFETLDRFREVTAAALLLLALLLLLLPFMLLLLL